MAKYELPDMTKLERVGESVVEPDTGGIICQILQDPGNRITMDWADLTYPPGSGSSQRLTKGKYSVETWVSGPLSIIRVRGRRSETFYYPECPIISIRIRPGDGIEIRNTGSETAYAFEEVCPAWDVIPDRYENGVKF